MKYYTSIIGNKKLDKEQIYLDTSLKKSMQVVNSDLWDNSTATIYEVTLKPLKKVKMGLVYIPLKETKKKTVKGKKH